MSSMFDKILAAALLLTTASAALGNEKIPRIGYITLSPILETPSAERLGFLRGLREHGYEDGKNVLIEYYSAEGDPEMLPFRAEQLVQDKVDVIVAGGMRVVEAAAEATRTIPIVMMFTADPVSTGLVKSLAKPGGNVTGMSPVNLELGAKRLELLKEAVPGIARVAVLWDSSNPAIVPEWRATEAEARRLGVTLLSVDVAGEENFVPAFGRITAEKPDALITLVDLRTASYRQIIPEFALKQRLPTMFGLRAFLDFGGLLSYGPDFADLSRRSAAYVDKILKGARPAGLPIQQPTHFALAVNLRTAEALGLEIPQAILTRADEVLR